MSKEMWDQRYTEPEYVYGTNSNEFFKRKLDKLSPGKILLPAEGEQLQFSSGGPREESMLFSQEELKEDFSTNPNGCCEIAQEQSELSRLFD